jgi:hypothetical protein
MKRVSEMTHDEYHPTYETWCPSCRAAKARRDGIIADHVQEFNKDNDRDPDRGELMEFLSERADEEGDSPLGREIADAARSLR